MSSELSAANSSLMALARRHDDAVDRAQDTIRADLILAKRAVVSVALTQTRLVDGTRPGS